MPRSITELEAYLDREFGPLDKLVDRSERRSRVTLDAAPSAGVLDVGDAGNAARPFLPEFEPQAYGKKEEGSMDRTRLLGAGVADLAEMGVGELEYVARQNKFLRPSVAPALEKVRGGISEIREGILSGISPEYLDRVGKEIMTLDPSRSIWRSGNPLEVADAIYGKMVRSLPSTLAVMYPAARLFRAGATNGALAYLGASEGGLSVGAIANNLTDEIKGMTNDELLKESQRYAQIYQQVGGDEVEARSRFTAEAQGIAPLVGGATVAAISLATGRMLKPVFAPAGGEAGLTLGKRIGVGFLEEFPQEGSQGVSEQIAQNFAAKIYDDNRPLMEGALEAFGQEGLIGGLTGGAVAGAFGTRPAKPLPPPTEEAPDTTGARQLNLPGFGPQQRDVVEPGYTDLGETDIDPETGKVIYRGRPTDPEEVAKRNEQLPLGPGLDLEERIKYDTRGGERVPLAPEDQYRGRDLSDSTEFALVPPASTEPEGTQLDLPLGDRRPLRDRGLGNRAIPPGTGAVPTQLPDAYDQPTAEPVTDIQAQLDDFKNKGGRTAVYLSPEQRNVPRKLPKGARVLPNWDDKGGTLIVKTAAVANKAQQLKNAVRDGTMTLQEAIGTLTLSGSGKPVQGEYVVQLKDAAGNVQRESMVRTEKQAKALKKKWGQMAEITTPSGALQRREQLMEQELRTEDVEEVDDRQLDIEGEIKQRTEDEARAKDQAEWDEAQRKFRFEEATREEFDETISDEEIERLATYSVAYPEAYEEEDPETKALLYKERKKVKRFETRAEAEDFAASVNAANEKVAAEYKAKPAKARIDVEGSEELDWMFERAVRAKGDRKAQTYDESPTGADKMGFLRNERAAASVEDEEAYKQSIGAGTTMSDTVPEGTVEEDSAEEAYGQAPSPATTVEKQARKDYGDTPGKKLKFIRRERGAQIRRKAEIRDVKDTKVVTKKVKGTKQTIRTRSLTYESIKSEESREQKATRLEAVKAAKARLRFALNRARRFAKRFETTGEYGRYTGEGYLQARDAYKQLIQLAETMLKPGTANSNDYATQAKKLAVALERIKLKGMTAEQFTNEFASIAKEQKAQELRIRPSDKRDSTKDMERSFKKSVGEKRSAEKWRAIRQAWNNNERFRKFVAPILQKFANTAWENFLDSYVIEGSLRVSETGRTKRERVYVPSFSEIEQLNDTLQAWRKPQSRKNPDIFYKPLRDELRRLGFEFFEDGNLKNFTPPTSEASDDTFQLPSGEIYPATDVYADFDGTLKKLPPVKLETADLKQAVREEKQKLLEERKARALERQKKRPSRKQMRPENAPAGSLRADVDERMELAEKRQAVREIETVNRLVERFKDRVANSKVTNNGIKREEQRLIRALRSLGVWTDTGPSTGTIRIGGYVSKMYSLVSPRLESKTNRITKARAKELIARNARIATPQELMPVWRSTRVGAEKTSAYDEQIQQLLDKSDEEAIDLYMEGVNLQEYEPSINEAASAIGDLIRDKWSVASATNVLDAIMEALPADHFYYRLAQKLRSMPGMQNVTLQYDWANQKFFGRKRNTWGLYDPNTTKAYLNRRVFNNEGNFAVTSSGMLVGAKAVHTTLHELLHAATAYEMKNNWGLNNHFFEVRAAAIAAWRQRFGDKNMPAGLQLKMNQEGKWTPVDEFLVEALGNEELQAFLKTVPVTVEGNRGVMATAWGAIKDAIIKLLGWGNVPVINNLFDAVMAPGDMVFRGAGMSTTKAADLNMGVDEVIDRTSSIIWNKLNQRETIWNRVKEKAKNPSVRFSGFAMNLMTMEQFVEAFYKFFDIRDANGKPFNPLRQYHDAFQKRNGHAAERMELPTEISGRWTSLEKNDPDAALEMSRVMTRSTLFRITPDKALDTPENEHLTSKEQQEVHAEMSARFNAMPEAAKKLYREVRAYYAGIVREEQKYILQSGLRGITGVEFSTEQLENVETKEDLHDLLKEYINDDERAELVDTLYELSRLPTKFKGDYFPAMRYGDHVVYAEGERQAEVFEDRASAQERRAEIAATDPTLDVSYGKDEDGNWVVRTMERDFRMAETKSEVFQKWEEMKKEYGDASHMKVFGPQLRRTVLRDEAIKSNAQLNSILKALTGDTHAQAAIKNFYLRSLSESSMRKHELTRKNRRGVDHDLQHRNLATYARQASYYISQLEYGWKMKEAKDAMHAYVSRREGADTHDLSKVRAHLEKRDAMSVDLPDANELIRTGVEGTHFFMLTSPSYWAINATQPFMVTLPTLAGKFGYGNSIMMMRKTMKMISPILGRQALKSRLGLKALTDRELREESFNVINQLLADLKNQVGVEEFAEFDTLIKTLRRQHIIDINVFTEMRELSQGKVGGAKGAWAGMVDASRVMAHLTEVNNRVLTSLTAFQLARNSGMTVEEATLYAGDITSQTQFNYSSANKPPLFQQGGPLGSVAPLMFQFMQWPQHMYAHLIRNYMGMVEAGVMNKSEARTALLGLLGTHAAVGGMVGMTLQPIKWAIGLALMGFGDEDEPYTLENALSGQTFDQLMAETMAELFGTELGTAVTKGIPAALGIDLSTRMSMGTLYFIDLRGDNPTSVLGSLVSSFGGATLNQGLNFSRGLGQAMDGDILRGLETASPKFGRDVLRAIRYYNEGLVNANGDTVIDTSEMSLYEIVAQAAGFAPTDIGDFYDAQAAMKGKERYVIDRKDRLLKQFRNAETVSDKRRIRSEIRAFNRANRQEAIDVDTLWSNREAQFKREFRYRRLGANIDEEKARFYREYGAPYRD